jgi:hypothetical protein
MASADIVSLTHTWFDEVWNKRNKAAIDELMAEHIELNGFAPDESSLHVREPYKETQKEYLRLFPDIHVDVERVVPHEQESIAWLNCYATADPKDWDLPGYPTSVMFSVVAWVCVSDGKFVAGKNLIDFGAVYEAVKGLSVRIKTPTLNACQWPKPKSLQNRPTCLASINGHEPISKLERLRRPDCHHCSIDATTPQFGRCAATPEAGKRLAGG